MNIPFSVYKDKMRGCWAGKNIGGVLGAPFEGKRQINNVDFYIQDLTGDPPPNDDLDLQLVWLNAVEVYGRHVNAQILGEYWLSYIIPDWVEYGSGKNNLRAGLPPPLSGHVDNTYRNSCGCFIRSELWACLAPGLPEIAAQYAYEDAIVDHASEGMYGEIFCAAMQSAAFIESDVRKLLAIGLSYIPADCCVARAIHAAVAAYDARKPFTDARDAVMTAAPGTFGIQNQKLADLPAENFPLGEPGFDAPGNIGLMIVGLLYGEGDFGKSICIANNCGEDTDCTAATLGALLGIILGYDRLPEKWLAPIGDKISTLCINRLSGTLYIPQTVTELTDRVLRVAPAFLGVEHVDLLAPGGYEVRACDPDGLMAVTTDPYLPGINASAAKGLRIDELLNLGPYAVLHRFHGFTAIVDLLDEPYIRVGENRTIRVTLMDTGRLGHQQFVTARLILPEGVHAVKGAIQSGVLQNLYRARTVLEFEVVAESIHGDRVDLFIDVATNARHSAATMKVTLYPRI